ncbi:MAG: 2Fe-2S iron-sulfur cluster-binding protein [Oscillospiraceae bacterium]
MPPSTAARRTRRTCWPRSCRSSACGTCRCTTCPSRTRAISSPSASARVIWSLSPRRTTRACS